MRKPDLPPIEEPQDEPAVPGDEDLSFEELMLLVFSGPGHFESLNEGEGEERETPDGTERDELP